MDALSTYFYPYHIFEMSICANCFNVYTNERNNDIRERVIIADLAGTESTEHCNEKYTNTN